MWAYSHRCEVSEIPNELKGDERLDGRGELSSKLVDCLESGGRLFILVS
jgi:hypothetical protein